MILDSTLGASQGRGTAPQRRRVALVTSGFRTGGGVPAVARWLAANLAATAAYVVDIHDLATSSRDPSSRRLLAPTSWTRSSLLRLDVEDPAVRHWGANAVEVEAMRYRPRRELTSALRGYDLVQVVSGSPALAAAALPAGVPVAMQVASPVVWERASRLAAWPMPVRRWRQLMTSVTTRIERVALRAADAVLVENAAMLDYVMSLGQRHVVKAPPGVDTDRFSPAPSGWRGDGHLLSVCRLGEPRKGLDLMIRAYARMVAADAAVPPLVLAGRGTPAPIIHALVRQLGLESRVTVRSDVALTELVELYRTASVFLQTSHEEGLGISVLEAMACGLPVVSTDTHGARETIVDGVTGWLVPLAKLDDVPDLFAERVLAVLAGQGRELGINGRSRCVAQFSSRAAIDRFIAVYDGLLGPSSTTPLPAGHGRQD